MCFTGHLAAGSRRTPSATCQTSQEPLSIKGQRMPCGGPAPTLLECPSSLQSGGPAWGCAWHFHLSVLSPGPVLIDNLDVDSCQQLPRLPCCVKLITHASTPCQYYSSWPHNLEWVAMHIIQNVTGSTMVYLCVLSTITIVLV